ncbi:hypothetical protein ACQX37_12015 [Corynebacterium diphtheriae]
MDTGEGGNVLSTRIKKRICRRIAGQENMEQEMIRKYRRSRVAGFFRIGDSSVGDVEYNATLKKEYIYCGSQKSLDEFGAFAQDGDEDGANKMVSDGKCRISWE